MVVETPVNTSSAELKEGDSIEARFLLSDQGVWTTSWYRGTISKVNRSPSGDDEKGDAASGASVPGQVEGGGAGGAGGAKGVGGEGVTYSVEFADGDRLDGVPPDHIRLFRGLQVRRKTPRVC